MGSGFRLGGSRGGSRAIQNGLRGLGEGVSRG